MFALFVGLCCYFFMFAIMTFVLKYYKSKNKIERIKEQIKFIQKHMPIDEQFDCYLMEHCYDFEDMIDSVRMKRYYDA
jgi:methyl coenzyme M reductase subunit C-like uncharacterized protein (methanogenesis marker protein 7)